MPAPLSVVIPTLDCAPAVGALLMDLMAGLASGLVREVIISDGGSSDDVAELAEAVGAEYLSGPPGRGGQLARGVEAARGGWLLVLHADSTLPDGWADVVEAAMAEADRAHVFRLAFDARGVLPRMVAAWANLRTRVFGLPYGDQGLLISRKLYDDAGGYAEIPLMEDVAMARALAGRIALLPATLITSAIRYEADGWLRRGARNLQCLVRYLAGGDPAALARHYGRGGGKDAS